ncbi:MAG: reprolysin-like metallopeptidase [Pyrinomonadaceae bacterium]
MRVLLLLVLPLALTAVARAQSLDGSHIWTPLDGGQLRSARMGDPALPTDFKAFRLNQAAMTGLLQSAPRELSNSPEAVISLPMPDGTFGRFSVEHSLVVEPGLLAKYPELGATYRGRGIDDPTATARFDLLPSGFHSIILSSSGTVLIDPYLNRKTGEYITYYKDAGARNGSFECEVGEEEEFEVLSTPSKLDLAAFVPGAMAPEVMSGTQLRTYRLALAATNEYAVRVGTDTIAGTLAAQVLIVNRVNGVYERDLAIRMVVIANNDLIAFAGNNMGCTDAAACTGANDPYTNSSGSTMLAENVNTLNSVIGAANFDIGHVFSTGGGGVATLNGPCGGSKARGVTGLGTPLGDAFSIDYVAHEMGHQFGANHTFNGAAGNCAGGNRSGANAYEPGSGVTIMAYAGICGAQDLALNSIDTFHVRSIEAITAFSQSGGGSACGTITDTGNTLPEITGPGNFNIPINTPFSLTATASDADGDDVTYDWQQYDTGGAIGSSTVPNTDSDGIARPILRPYLPTIDGTRTFPSMQYILDNANVPPATTGGRLTGELLPAITRSMNFQVIARDNRAGAGGIRTATSVVTVSALSGPFAVTAPNSSTSFAGNSTQTVTWAAANTTLPPVSAAQVQIRLSTDGGNTFPHILSASTANDGSDTVTMPNTPTSTARVKIEAVGNIFFDISDTNFTITAGYEVAGSVFTPDARGLRNASVIMTDAAGASRTVVTSSFGFYSIGNLTPGQSYRVRVVSRKFRFAVRQLTASNNVSGFDFVGLE